jgi:gliding motility-associated-like protein
MLKRIYITLLLLASGLASAPLWGQADTLCISAPTNNYYVTGLSNSTFQWDTQGFGTINSGQGTSTVNITWSNIPGTYQLTVVETSSNGCPGAPQTTQVVILPTLTSTNTITICTSQLPFMWNGLTFITGGSQSANLIAASGCDSTATLNLLVNSFVTATDVRTECESFIWIDGNSYSSSTNTPTFTIPNGSSLGCDSVITLNLTINSISSSTDVQIACGSYTWIDGVTYYASTNSPTFTIPNGSVAGCDSIITLDLSIIPSTNNTTVASACSSYTWVIDGLTYTNSGTYTSETACHTETLELTINPFVSNTSTIYSCGNYTWNVNGQTYTNSGIFVDTNACAIEILNLTVNQANQDTLNVSICSGSSFSFNGNTYTSSGTYWATLQNISGCDSTVTLVLSVTDVLNSTVNASICNNSNYTLPDGTVVDSSGSYPITLNSSTGCDSIVTTILEIIPPINIDVFVSICLGATYKLPDGTIANSSGIYPITFQSNVGCDSIITTYLTVIEPVLFTQDVSICEGETFKLPDGSSATTSNSYITILSAASGCDSIVTTNLNVQNAIELITSGDTSICSGQSVILSASGASTINWQASSGLLNTTGNTVTAIPNDSVMVYITATEGVCSASDSLFITLLSRPEISIQATGSIICLGDSIELSAIGANSYVWNSSSILSCDTCQTIFATPSDTSIISLSGLVETCWDTTTFIIYPIVPIVAQITGDTAVCEGFSIELVASGGLGYQWSTGDSTSSIVLNPVASMEVSVIVNTGLCYDTTTFDFDVNPNPFVYTGLDTSIIYGTTAEIQASSSNEIMWEFNSTLSCDNCLSPIASPLETTTYCATSVNEFGCYLTDCILITVDTLCKDLFIPNVFSPIEGGHSENDCFKMYGTNCIGTMTLSIFDRWGEKVFVSTGVDECWDGTYKGKALNTGVYIYYLTAELITGETLNKQGNLTLLR